MRPTNIILPILSLAASPILCLPQLPAEEPHEKRQNSDYSQLLELASLAGIPVPTDPAVLLSIAPIAASLNSLLPTAPVLSVLETAAPSGLLSSLVHDPTFAASWLSSFEKGPSPSWFLALPTSARGYLHTYADGGNLGAVATAAAGIQSVESAVSSQKSVSSAAHAGGNATSTGGAVAGGGSGTTAGGSSSGVTGSSSTGGLSSSTTSASTLSSSSSTAGAARETGVFAAGAVAMAGILGLAVAL
ncbi:MAG: hypothetical protein GOMPHAMPRED_006574 [Gomphillus americanus]|uniref:Uncharacterized protein n=1 Tax=Gomphillus americanus TaxID=1940652 RepID=A0A8H3FYH9_9LECA|nr:MAG: hypothetical protein GOMPHAMPRED_006574 [Gomphillus americanus]